MHHENWPRDTWRPLKSPGLISSPWLNHQPIFQTFRAPVDVDTRRARRISAPCFYFLAPVTLVERPHHFLSFSLCLPIYSLARSEGHFACQWKIGGKIGTVKQEIWSSENYLGLLHVVVKVFAGIIGKRWNGITFNNIEIILSQTLACSSDDFAVKGSGKCWCHDR